MKTFLRSVIAAFALAFFVPFAVQAQTPPKPAVKPAPLKASAEARWDKLLAAAQVLAQEGTEVKRITRGEQLAIIAYIHQVQQFIAKAKQGGITEEEEDTIDTNLAGMFEQIAKYMSDPVRRGAPAPQPAAPKPAAPPR